MMIYRQCDRIAVLFTEYLAIFNIKICPMGFKICQSKLKILPNTNYTLLKWSQFFNVVPNWWNFAKSGHTVYRIRSTLVLTNFWNTFLSLSIIELFQYIT